VPHQFRPNEIQARKSPRQRQQSPTMGVQVGAGDNHSLKWLKDDKQRQKQQY